MSEPNEFGHFQEDVRHLLGGELQTEKAWKTHLIGLTAQLGQFCAHVNGAFYEKELKDFAASKRAGTKVSLDITPVDPEQTADFVGALLFQAVCLCNLSGIQLGACANEVVETLAKQHAAQVGPEPEQS